ncbi:hypothetical protein TrVE_jg7215 [Triparma verrucosa]|uniref:Uncharacterized protein n=1 Tax=Triparma verrucosa TaxID=1606542 RepID=A0A9W7C1G8_9STRA|nr:hypothetical protein TrVE_jg7215 [Triparma verrucosa]
MDPFSDSDDDVKPVNVAGDAAAGEEEKRTGKKKKKRRPRNKKKKAPPPPPEKPVYSSTEIIINDIASTHPQFSLEQIQAAVDELFTSNEKYDDKDTVIRYLKGEKAPQSPPQSPSKSPKSPKSSKSKDEEASSSLSSPAPSPTKSKSKATALSPKNAKQKQQKQTPPPLKENLSIIQKLEYTVTDPLASFKDSAYAISGWCADASPSDLSSFVRSPALEKFLHKSLSPPDSEFNKVLPTLLQILETTLRAPPPVWSACSEITVKILTASRSLLSSGSSSVSVSQIPPRLCKVFSTIAPSPSSPTSSTLNKLTRSLNALKPHNVESQPGEPLKVLFPRFEVQSESVDLAFEVLKISDTNKPIYSELKRISEGLKDAILGEDIRKKIKEAGGEEFDGVRKSMEEVKEKQKSLTSIPTSKISEINVELSSIAAEKEALLSKIRSLTERQTELEKLRDEQAREVAQVHEQFTSKFADLDSRFKGYGQLKLVSDATEDLTVAFDSFFPSLTSAAIPSSTVNQKSTPTKLGDLVTRVHMYLSTTHACTSHLLSRINSSTKKLQSDSSEIVEYEALGLHDTVTEMVATMDREKKNIEDDEKVVQKLKGLVEGVNERLEGVMGGMGEESSVRMALADGWESCIKAGELFEKMGVGSSLPRVRGEEKRVEERKGEGKKKEEVDMKKYFGWGGGGGKKKSVEMKNVLMEEKEREAEKKSD